MPWMWFFFGELVWLPFQGPASLNGYVVYEKYCNNGEKLSYSCLDPSNHSSMHISTDTKYINPWLKTFEWFLFWIQEENLNMKVLVLYSHFCSCRFFSSATLPSARIVEISPWKKVIFSRKNTAWIDSKSICSITFLHYVLTRKTLLQNMYIVQPAWTPRVRLSHQGDSALRSDRTPLDLCSLASWSSQQSRGSKTCDGGLLGIARSACLRGAERRWCTSAADYSEWLLPLKWWCYWMLYKLFLHWWDEKRRRKGNAT